MIFLLDTNAFSDLMRDHPKVDTRLASLAATDQVVICAVVSGEIHRASHGLVWQARQIFKGKGGSVLQ